MKFNLNGITYKIRRIKKKDAQAYYNLSIINKTESYITNTPFNNLKEAKIHLIKMYFTKTAKKLAKGYAVIDLKTNKMIGIVELHSYNINTHSASLGYILNKNYWNQGIMSKAVKIIVNLAFKKFNYFSLLAKTVKDNIASIKILEKLNFQLVQIKEKNNITYYYFKLERISYL